MARLAKNTPIARRNALSVACSVGLKADDGKTSLLIGEHLPLNAEIAPYPAKKITVEGKVVSRDGINLIESADGQK